jgi:hypothetical protein
MTEWTFEQWVTWAKALPRYTRVFVTDTVFEALCVRHMEYRRSLLLPWPEGAFVINLLTVRVQRRAQV